MNLLFHSPDENLDDWRAALARWLPEARLHAWPTAVECDYALVWKPPAELFAAQSTLKAVFNLGAGVDALLAAGTVPASLPLVRLEDAGMARQMVEYALYALLHHYRGFDAYARQQARGEWRQHPGRRREDCRVGVLGLGVLGRAVAEAVCGLGFPVSAWSRAPKTVEGVRCHAGATGLDALLAESEVLIVLLPLTGDTRSLLDRARLARLPRGAYLVNLARGALLVEDDLLALLDEGHLGGAMLDVFATEPLPPEHRFWSHPLVTVTPHISALTLIEESAAQIADKLRRLERGEPITGVVERGRGY